MKYITDPQTMLKAKCQAEVCREMAPDVLMGIGYSREELESEDQRQFDNERPERAPANKVTEDEIFAEEVPLDTEAGDTEAGDQPADNPAPAPEPAADAADEAQAAPEPAPAPDTTEQPAGDAETPTQTVDPSPAAPEPTIDVTPDTDKAIADVQAAAKQAEVDKAAAAKSKTIAGKRNTAPAADPDRPKSRMRKALEKRLYALLGDAGYADDVNRDGKIALYRGILERPDVNSNRRPGRRGRRRRGRQAVFLAATERAGRRSGEDRFRCGCRRDVRGARRGSHR